MAGLLYAIHQPNFLPRLSTLAKVCAADIWVILDDVQFSRRDYQNRCSRPPAADLRDRCPIGMGRTASSGTIKGEIRCRATRRR